jgi:hypothetical protein
MVREQPVMVPDFYLVADGKTGESAVIERSPTRVEIRRSTDTITLTNHALTPPFAADRENDRLKRYLTSGARGRRLDELVASWRGRLDPAGALAILRDRSDVGGAPLGLGNRNALDAIIATHSVVVDATDLIVWVSEGPHLVGRYVGYDLRKELGAPDRAEPPDLPPDALAGSEALRVHLQAEAELRCATRLAASAPDRALECAEKAAALQPDLPEPHKLLGDLLRAGDKTRAAVEYRRFLGLHPPYLRDIEEVQSVLGTL